MRSTVADARLDDQARAIERRLSEIRVELVGNRQREMYGDPGPVPISRRLGVVQIGTGASTYGPTATHRESFEIARDDFGRLRTVLQQLMESELPALEASLDEAGVPWTPGRGVPRSR